MKAIVFPGQGAQYKGMGKDLYDNFPKAKDMFLRIDNILGKEVSSLCFSGEGELSEIYNQQLAILATSLASYEVFKEKKIKVDFVSGLSLGIYSCLYPTEVLSLEDLVLLVEKRAQVTKDAARAIPSSMLAIIGKEKSYLEDIVKEEDCYIANINSSRQIVIAVADENKEKIKSILSRGSVKVREVDTGGGFHSPLMDLATDNLRAYAAGVKFNDPCVPIISNLTARPLESKDQVRQSIVDQLSRTVYWKDCIEYMISSGVDTFFEIGPSQILKGLIKDIASEVQVINLESKEDFDKL